MYDWMHFGNHNYNPYMFYIKHVVMRIIQIIFFMKHYCTVWDTTYDSPMIWRKIRTTKTKLMGLSRETDTGLQDIISKYGEFREIFVKWMETSKEYYLGHMICWTKWQKVHKFSRFDWIGVVLKIPPKNCNHIQIMKYFSIYLSFDCIIFCTPLLAESAVINVSM
jgi:hypothetical protein